MKQIMTITLGKKINIANFFVFDIFPDYLINQQGDKYWVFWPIVTSDSGLS